MTTRLKILELIESGSLTAAEADRLLETLDNTPASPEPESEPSGYGNFTLNLPESLFKQDTKFAKLLAMFGKDPSVIADVIRKLNVDTVDANGNRFKIQVK